MAMQGSCHTRLRVLPPKERTSRRRRCVVGSGKLSLVHDFDLTLGPCLLGNLAVVLCDDGREIVERRRVWNVGSSRPVGDAVA